MGHSLGPPSNFMLATGLVIHIWHMRIRYNLLSLAYHTENARLFLFKPNMIK